MSPERDSISETKKTLDYASFAKRIHNKAIVNSKLVARDQVGPAEVPRSDHETPLLRQQLLKETQASDAAAEHAILAESEADKLRLERDQADKRLQVMQETLRLERAQADRGLQDLMVKKEALTAAKRRIEDLRQENARLKEQQVAKVKSGLHSRHHPYL